MRSLEEPEAPRGRGLPWILLVLAMLGGAAAWYATTRPATPVTSADPTRRPSEGAAPSSGNDRKGATERNNTDAGEITPRPGKSSRTPDAARTARAPATLAPAPSATVPREFRVTSDVPGAYVFLNRKFLGTTPFTSREVAPGTYQLNVQTEGHPPVVRTVDVKPDGLTEVAVTMPASAQTAAATSALQADVAVVHQHAMGSCEGTLRASADGFRYETPHRDAFCAPVRQRRDLCRRLRREASPAQAARRTLLELHDDRRQRRSAVRVPPRRRGGTAVGKPRGQSQKGEKRKQGKKTQPKRKGPRGKS